MQYFRSFCIAGKIKDTWHLHKQEWLSTVKKCKITCPYNKHQNCFFTQPSTDSFQKTLLGRAMHLPSSLHPHCPYIQGSQAFAWLSSLVSLAAFVPGSVQRLPPAFLQVCSRKWPSFSAVLIQWAAYCNNVGLFFPAYPPKVFSVCILGNRIAGVDLSYKGSKTCSFWDVLFAYNSSDL